MLFRLSDVWKSYGGTEILKGVSFQVNVNEKVGLVGRSHRIKHARKILSGFNEAIVCR